MELSELQQDIKNNTLKPIYVFTGIEYEIMKIYINQIKKPVLSTFSVAEAVRLCKSSSLLGNTSKIYKVYYDAEFFVNDLAWDKVEDLLGNNTLILIITEIDKRSKFYKRFKDHIVEFDKLPQNVVMKYLQKAINLSNIYLSELFDICDGCYSVALKEIDKINSYTSEDNKDQAFVKLKTDGIITKYGEYDYTLDVMNYLLSRDCKNACAYGAKIPQDKVIYLLAVVYNGFRQVLSVQGLGANKENASERTGLTPWQVKNAIPHLNYYTIEELQDNLLFIRKLEMGVKTGRYNPKNIVDLLILGILGGDKV